MARPTPMAHAGLLGAWLFLAGLPAGLAAQDLVGDRPTFTPSPLTVPRGRVQIEAGYTGADLAAATVHSLGEVLLRIGITAPVELRLGWLGYGWVDPSGSAATVSGANDGSLGIKWTVSRGAATGGTDIGILLGTSVPVGSDAIGTGEWEPGASVVLGWALADGLSLTASGGYTYRTVARRFDQGFVSAVFSAATTPSFQLFLEGYAFNKEQADGSVAFLANGGFVLALGNAWLVDGRLGVGMGDSSTNLFAGFGLVTAW